MVFVDLLESPLPPSFPRIPNCCVSC